MAELRIDVSDTTSPTVVVLNGDVELSTAARLRDRLNAVAASGVSDVVVDLRDAVVVDATGLGILLFGVDRLSEHGHVVLRSPSLYLRELLLHAADRMNLSIEPATP